MHNLISVLMKAYSAVAPPQKLLLVFCALILLVSCKRPKTDNNAFEIMLQKEESVKASSVFSDMKLIKLETRNECMLAAIRNYEISDGLLYVLDILRQGVYVFDLEGGFVKSLKRMGKGEGEYTSIEDFFVDQESNTIEILDKRRMSILIYNLEDFSYIDRIQLPFTFCFNFTKKDNLYYFQTNNAANSIGELITNSEIIVFDANSEIAKPLTDIKLPSSESQAWEFYNVFTTNCNNEIFVSLAWHENIFKIDGENLIPYIYMNRGRRGLPREILSATYEEKMNYLQSYEMEGKSHFFKLLMDNENGLIIGYGIGYPPKPCYYMRLNNGKDIYFADNIEIDFTPFTNLSLDIFKETDGYVSSVLYPHELDDNDLLVNSISLSEEDNPIVLLFDL